jgi:hypothetical protein
MTYNDAKTTCADVGGWLVAYNSDAEQLQAEAYFTGTSRVSDDVLCWRLPRRLPGWETAAKPVAAAGINCYLLLP